MTHASLNLQTALGGFRFVAECEHVTGEVSLDMRAVEPRVVLPDKMSVAGCWAAVLRVRTIEADGTFLRWWCESPRGVQGSPCTGEGLEAQAWEARGRLVVVGTEDAEVLSHRLGFVDPRESLIEYSPGKMVMRLARLPRSASFGLHFILAENPSPEPVEASAWFAVDVRHERLA